MNWIQRLFDDGERTITEYWIPIDGETRIVKKVKWKIRYKKGFRFTYCFADTFLNCADYCNARGIGGFKQENK